MKHSEKIIDSHMQEGNGAVTHEENLTSHATSIKQFNTKFILLLVGLFIIIVGLLIFEFIANSKKQVKTITIKKQMLVRRSKDLGLIARGLTGKAVDVNTGKIVIAARIFSTNDNTVYLELDLQSPPKGTYIDYIRYKEGRYVDHGQLAISQANTKNVLFDWSINKLLAGVTNGNWRIATYANGILAKRIAYQIQGNKVSYIYPQQTILSTDPDYHLANSLASAAEK